MSNYRNIEINLLPPELQPPPTVRTAVILNIALVLAVLAYMGLQTVMTLAEIRNQQEQIKEAEAKIESKQPIVTMYTELSNVKEEVNKYGRLVSLASVDYVDVPVLLDRLARIIPAGVYLSRVSNEKATPSSKSTLVQVELLTTRNDPALMQATIDAFKGDSIFHDCFLRDAELRKESINGQLPEFGVDWQVTGPTIPESIDVNKYQFIVLANVPKLADTAGLPVIADHSVYLADVEFKTPPVEEEEPKDGKGRRAKARKAGAEKAEGDAANAPEGVKPVEVN